MKDLTKLMIYLTTMLAILLGATSLALAQVEIPLDPLTGSADQLKALFDGAFAAFGAGGTAGIAGMVLALAAFVAKQGVAVLRAGAIQKRLPDKLKWENLNLVFRALIVGVFAFLVLFLGSVAAVGAKAAAIAAASGAVVTALGAMGVKSIEKTQKDEAVNP